jgi:transposase-like protein
MAFMEKRRRFSVQFKAAAVQMVIHSGHPITQVARELQINPGTLGNWVNTWKRENPEPEPDLTPLDRARIGEMQKEIRELRMEWGSLPQLAVGESFKTSGELLRADTVAERYELIQMEKPNYPITMMCRVLKVARSSYYEWVDRIGVITNTAAHRDEVGEAVKAEFDETYGCLWGYRPYGAKRLGEDRIRFERARRDVQYRPGRRHHA